MMSAKVACTAEHDQDLAELSFPNGHWYIMPNYQAIIPGSGEDAEKRARLFAAAPDLLAALRRLLASSKEMLERDFVAQWRQGDELSEEVVQAEAAIAKAEGRP